ncbi:MAG: hypothetical protein HYX96_08600 [Chloroflexi bacterium]|nr:hypothetical protein [Chloroflexota bacterium]
MNWSQHHMRHHSVNSTVIERRLPLAQQAGDDTLGQRKPAFCLDRRVTSTGIFVAAGVILLLYALGMRFHAYLPVPLFFLSVSLLVGVIIYQVLALSLAGPFAAVVLAEITAAALLFHLTLQIPGYGLLGSDAYWDMTSTRSILMSGYIRGVPEFVQLTSFFPMMHILGAQVTLVTGIDYFTVAKWLPSFLDVAIVPFLYLLVRLVFKSQRAALLSALIFAALQHHILFGSLFIRETIALILMACSFYLYMAAGSSGHPVAYRALSILTLSGVILAHHLTAFMLVAFLVVHWLVTGLFRLGRRGWSLPTPASEPLSLSFVLIAVVGVFTYWVNTIIDPLQILAIFVRNLFSPQVWGTYTYMGQSTLSLPNIRYYFLVYGSYFCYLVFGLLLVRRLLSRRWSLSAETYSFTFYLLMCGAAGLVAFYLVPATVGGDRFLTFGWFFGAGPLAMAVLQDSRKWLARAGLFFIILFLSLNLYTIHPTIWNPKADGSGGAAWREDFALAEKVDFAQGPVLADLNTLMPIYFLQNRMNVDAYALSDPMDLKVFNWIVVNRSGLEEEGLYTKYSLAAIADMKSLVKEEPAFFNKAYESGNLAVFRRR